MTAAPKTDSSSPQPVGNDQRSISWAGFVQNVPLASVALISLAVWLHAADELVVATMMPSILESIGGANMVSWSVSLYIIASLVAGATSALLTMRHGLRGPMAGAAALFALGCLISAIAPTMQIMLLGRLVQGLGGGGLVAMGFVAIGVLIPPLYVPRCLAVVSAFWGASAFLGPLIGGLFVAMGHWRLGFVFFALKALMLAFWIANRSNPAPPRAEHPSGELPWRRLSLLCLAVLFISLAAMWADALRSPLGLVLGLAFLALFLQLDARQDSSRLLPRPALSLSHPIGSAGLMLVCLTMAGAAIIAYGPLMIIVLHEVSALSAGYMLACSSIGWTCAAILVSGSPAHYDRRMIAIGVMMVVTALSGFAFALPYGPVWLLAMLLFLEGAGFGTAWTFILRRLTTLAAPSEAARISGALPTLQRLGYALGAGFSGLIANLAGFATISGPDDAIHVARWVFLATLPFGGMALIALYATLREAAPPAPKFPR